MNRCIFRAILAFVVGAVAMVVFLALSESSGETFSFFLVVRLLIADPFLAFISLAVPAVLSVATVIWSKRVHRLRLSQQIMANELARAREELNGIRSRLADANAENEQVRDQLVQTTARMRLRLSRLLSPKYSRERAIEPSDVLDMDRMHELQDTLSSALGIGSSLRDKSGDLIGRIHNGTDFCRAVMDTSLGKQDCFWFCREMGGKAVSRKAPVYKQCTACGLMCGAVAITVDDRHVATWVIGQVRVPELGDTDAVTLASRLGISPNLLLGHQRATRSMALGEFQTALRLVWHVAQEVSGRSRSDWHLSRQISTRRRAELQLRLAWHALDTSGLALVFLGRDNECVGATEAARRRLDYADSEFRKLKLDDLMSPADLSTALSGFDRDVSACEISILDSRGRSIPVRAELCRVVVGGKQNRYFVFHSAAAPGSPTMPKEGNDPNAALSQSLQVEI